MGRQAIQIARNLLKQKNNSSFCWIHFIVTFNEKLFASFSYLPYNVPKIVRPLFRTMSIVFKIISEPFVSTFVFKILFKHSHCRRFLLFILFSSKVFSYQARHKKLIQKVSAKNQKRSWYTSYSWLTNFQVLAFMAMGQSRWPL